MKLSKSSILMYLNCPKAFWYKYHTAVKGKKLDYGTKGKDVHKAIDEYYRNDKPLDLSIPELKVFSELKLEKPLHSELHLEDDTYIGFLDRVTEKSIGDYKTGGKAPHHFLFELVFYSMLYERIMHKQINLVEVIYLNPKRVKKIHTTLVTDKEREWCWDTVKFVQQNIKAENFNMGSKPNCYFCQFSDICKKDVETKRFKRFGVI